MASITSGMFQESCDNCSKVSKVETSINGKQKLCKSCMIDQFEYYKKQRFDYCSQIEKVAEFYKKQIENLSPSLNNNLHRINQVIDQVEEQYNSLLAQLNKQKQELLTTATECKKDNVKFFDLKNELSQVITNLNIFRDPTQNLYEENAIKNLVHKFEQSFELGQNIEKKYSDLLREPVRTIERYDRGPKFPAETRYFGQIFVTDSKNERTLAPIQETVHVLGSATLKEQYEKNAPSYDKWIKISSEVPTMTVKFDKEPAFLAAYRNMLFVVNDKSDLTLLSISNQNNFEVRGNFKIPIPTVRSIAVNANYFGITYTDLDKRIMKQKHYKPHGINLYQRTVDLVDFNMERKFELDVAEFIFPIGLALDADFLYVCDKGLKAVFKMDINKGSTVARIDYPKGQPYKLAVNKSYLVVTDPVQHLLNVYDVKNLRFISNVNLEQPKAKNGPFSVYITDDDTIFFKNYADSQLAIVDIHLNQHCVFTKITSSIQGFTVLECLNNHKILVVGSIIKNNDYKLICFLVN